MIGECHAHLFMDGVDYRQAVADHRREPQISLIRDHLEAYRRKGITFVREGGDHFGVSVLGKELAPEYGIDYRSPVFAICKKNHYGRIVGKAAEDWKEFRQLVGEVKAAKGDFIKIMVSGIMEYSAFGLLSEEAVEDDWIREMIHIAHEEGMAVMVHGNGEKAVLSAVLAGADSIEHGNYLNQECLDAMKETGCVWVPTIVTTRNLLGCGRYNEKVLQQIYQMECNNLLNGFEKGVFIAVGSDAGAYKVLHGEGALQEEAIFLEELMKHGYQKQEIQKRLYEAEGIIKSKFKNN